MALSIDRWKVPDNWLKIKTIDLHTGGEPLRVLVDGVPKIKGNTILEKRRFFKENLDYIRKGIIFEPRGHADMYAAVLTDPITEDAHFGTFFLHNEGYSTMCGHAIIALVKLVVDNSMIQLAEENSVIIIDAPPGRIYARATMRDGLVESVSFENVPSYVHLANQQLDIEGIGLVRFDIAYGGAYYAFCDADELGISLSTDNYNKLIELGRNIKQSVALNHQIEHPFEEDLGFLYGTIFVGESDRPECHSKNVCIFAEGEVDRSATGSGVSARAAIHYANKEIGIGEELLIESILGTTMRVKVLRETNYGSYSAVIPQVSGTAFITGRHEFVFDPSDPLKEGFIFR